MQINYLYLYSNRIDVFTNALASWQAERYRRVYNRNIKIYRGVDNRIDIQVRNSDEKAISVANSSMVFNLFSNGREEIVIQKDCTEVDATTGKVYVTLTEKELFNIEKGFYNYSIVQEVRETINVDEYRVTSRTPMYIDSQYGVKAIIEIVGEASGNAYPTTYVDAFDYTNPAATGDPDPAFYISSLINAKPLTSSASSLHTFQFYSSNYNGSVVIQGSLDKQGGSPYTWTDIDTFTIASANEYRNVEGKWNWFRIKYIPTSGTIDKVLYR